MTEISTGGNPAAGNQAPDAGNNLSRRCSLRSRPRDGRAWTVIADHGSRLVVRRPTGPGRLDLQLTVDLDDVAEVW